MIICIAFIVIAVLVLFDEWSPAYVRVAAFVLMAGMGLALFGYLAG